MHVVLYARKGGACLRAREGKEWFFGAFRSRVPLLINNRLVGWFGSRAPNAPMLRRKAQRDKRDTPEFVCIACKKDIIA